MVMPLDTLIKLRSVLEPRARRRALLLLGMMMLMGLLETAGVASIMPFITVVGNPDIVHTKGYLLDVYQALGFETTNEFLIFLGIVFFAVIVVTTTFRALTAWAIIRFTSMRSYTLSRQLFRGYLHQSYSWFLSRHTADLSKTMLSEVNEVIGGVLLPALQLIANGIVALCLLVLLLVLDPLLAGTVIIFLGAPYCLILWLSRKYVTRIGNERVRANRRRFQVSQEALAAIKDVKILGVEENFLRRFEKPSLRYVQRSATSKLIRQLPQFALQIIALGGVILVIQYQLVVHGNLGQALPLVAVYALAGYRLVPAFQRIYGGLSGLRFSKPALDHLHRDLFEYKANENFQSAAPSSPLMLQHSMTLSNVTYCYPGTRSSALTQVNMDIPVRSTVGLVGLTGAGKTTVVDIILGLLKPQTGRLLVDGIPVNSENMRAWRCRVGYVPQSIFLADDTIASNIAFGVAKNEIDMAAVEKAARVANLHTLIVEELENGYQTLIGERGLRLSGGQRQRIGIARALYRDPEILIMDEATSALDNITERAVMDAVRNLTHRKTIILIAHRLTTVRRCDIIYLMKRGRVVANGNYDELADRNDQFRAMIHAATA